MPPHMVEDNRKITCKYWNLIGGCGHRKGKNNSSKIIVIPASLKLYSKLCLSEQQYQRLNTMGMIDFIKI